MKNIIIIISSIFLFLGIEINAQIAVIANKSVSENSVNSGNLSDIYTAKVKTWSDGSKVIRFTLKSETISEKFFGFIGKSHADMKKLWMKTQLTGGGQAPEALGVDEDVINKVSSTPGAIGFINASKVNDKVKVLLTIN